MRLRDGAPPAIRLRAFTAADAAAIRRWEGAPEPFLHAEDLLECAEVADTLTSVAVDDDDDVVAVFQAAPDDDGKRSVALLVHPGWRHAGVGTASLKAALHEPCYAGSVLRATIDRDNAASLRCFASCGFTSDDDDDGPAGYARLIHRAAT